MTDDTENFRKAFQQPGFLDDMPNDSPPPDYPKPEAEESTENNPPPGPEWPDPTPMTEWLSEGELDILPEEIIEGVLHRGCKMILGGGSKSYKTWTLLDLGLSVASGEQWLGFKTRKSRVLYIDLELLPVFFRQRSRSIQKAKRFDAPPNFLSWNLRGVCYDSGLILRELQRWASEFAEPLDLIIIDPIYKLNAGGDENAAGEVARLMLDIERFANDLGAAVVFAHHYAKGDMTGRDPIDRCSGSGAFARDPDTILSMTRHAEDFCLTVDTSLRNHRGMEPFVIKFNPEKKVMERADHDPNRLYKPGQQERPRREQVEAPPPTLEELAGILPAGGADRKSVYTLAKCHLKWGKATVDRVLDSSELEGSPFITRITEGKGKPSLYKALS